MNDICVDRTGEFVGSCSQDGTVVISSMYGAEASTHWYHRPVCAIALDGEYSVRRVFTTGGLAGQLVLNTKGWFGAKDAIIHAGEGPVRLLDLASGAGSTVAALSGRLGASQNWLLTDNDPALLEVSRQRFSRFGQGAVACRQVDLAGDLASLPFVNVDGVTTSAFLDLVTPPFLEQLVGLVTAARLPFLASLTYDGRASCTPADPFDEDIRQAMNAHQKTDKGFGAALGPDAAAAAEALFEAAGYRVVSGPSDWHTDRNALAFQQELMRLTLLIYQVQIEGEMKTALTMNC